MVTHDEIRWGYRMLFGREPESEDAYRAHARIADVEALRQVLIRSPEGLARLRSDMRVAAASYDFDYFRPLLAFIHMEKTAGTSLYDVLAAHHGPARSSPPHLAHLPELPLGELNRYDFVSGHFSFQEAMALPRSRKRCITMFREPFARLVSFYRFQRAHPPAADPDPIAVLARTLDPAAFFRHPMIRRSHRTNNLYLRTFGPAARRRRFRLSGRMSATLASRRPALDLAARHIESLDALGLTEDMDNSMRLIRASLGIPLPATLPRLQVTDGFHAGTAGFAAVAPIVLTPELRAAMLPLVRHDLELYRHAEHLFRQRLATLDGAAPAASPPPPPLPPGRWTTRARGRGAAARPGARPAP